MSSLPFLRSISVRQVEADGACLNQWFRPQDRQLALSSCMDLPEKEDPIVSLIIVSSTDTREGNQQRQRGLLSLITPGTKEC